MFEGLGETKLPLRPVIKAGFHERGNRTRSRNQKRRAIRCNEIKLSETEAEAKE